MSYYEGLHIFGLRNILEMNTEKKGSKLAIGFIIAAVATRMIPHVPNFTAMESLALFAGAYLGWKVLAAITPFFAWYLSDLIINNTISRAWYPDVDGIVWYADYMPTVYISAIIIIFLGSKFLNKWSPGKLALSALCASLLFFVISNFGTWMSGLLYPKTGAGLLACFEAAIPFLRTSLLSNLLFTAILFGGYELAHRYLYKTHANMKLA